ncbi:MAG: DUF4198 domain-containing protein [Pseudomonadota bacterium]
MFSQPVPQIQRIVAALAMACSTVVPANAHEMWLDPLEFLVGEDAEIQIEFRVGEKYSGGGYPYLENRTERLDHAAGDMVQPVDARSGDRPAIQTAPLAPGLNVFAYESDVSTVRYTDFGKFTAFVEHKAFKGALAAHDARDLSKENFVETYSRHAKALIAVGRGEGADRRIGMQTEIVALDNPYVKDIKDGMRVQVFHGDETRPGAQVEVFERAAGSGNNAETVTISLFITNAEGVATIAVKPGHEYQVDAVVLREPPADRAQEHGAVWDTVWANLTFAVPKTPIR